MHLYITEQGSSIRKQGNHIHVSKGNRLLGDYIIDGIESATFMGSVSASSDALFALSNSGASVVFLDRQGRFKGKLAPPSAKNVSLKLAQYNAFQDPNRSFELAKDYVVQKIQNGYAVLDACAKNSHNPFTFNDRQKFQSALKSAIDCEAPDKNKLRGYEGAAAKLYFANFGKCLMHGITFTSRKFHPCTDPVNAILSLGYAFTSKRIETMLESYGLDPTIGFLHEPEYGRSSLALDILEEFRQPLVDRLVLKLFNRKILTGEHFTRANEAPKTPVQLTHEGMQAFIQQYEETYNGPNRIYTDSENISWSSLIRQRVEALRRALLDNTELNPFLNQEVA